MRATPDRLEAREVSVHFDGLKAVDRVTLRLEGKEILGLIGPNGAGKTTLMNALTGFLSPVEGQLFLSGSDVTGQAPHRLARLGVVRTFQNLRLFRTMTVSENIEMGALGVGARRSASNVRAAEIADILQLRGKLSLRADGLSYGEEQLVAIGRALAADPRFLLLDEPAAGLNEAETDLLTATIRSIRSRYTCGVLVIEHDMRLIMSLCDRVQVLDHGKTICIGTPTEVQTDVGVMEAYLGAEAARDSVSD